MQFDRVTHHVEDATGTQARAVVFVQEVHDDFDVDPGGGAEAHEVHVDRLIGDRIELQIARQHPMGLAVDFDLVNAAEEARRVDLFPELDGIDGDHHRILFVAIDDTRHTALAACCTGCPLTCPIPRFGGETRNVGHFQLLGCSDGTASRGAVPGRAQAYACAKEAHT